jgi:hypothetical protein
LTRLRDALASLLPDARVGSPDRVEDPSARRG